jgi:hypothetical protein
MPASVGLCSSRRLFCAGHLAQVMWRRPWSGCVLRSEGLPLEPKQHRARMRRWMGAGCALALICASPCTALGQSSAANSGAGAGTRSTAANPKTANPTTHAKATAKSSKACSPTHSSTQAKPHPASHPAAGTHPKSSTAAAARSSKSKYASSRKNGKRKTARGQQKIEPERAQAIQEALIREHYLSGEAVGTWNQSSEEAMRRYQADHGWQSKEVPDSRALISLGLGPSHDHLLNPESAMTTEPAAPSAASLTPASHSADAGARMSMTPAVAPATTAPAKHDSPGPQ